jgi:hypothetical protein
LSAVVSPKAPTASNDFPMALIIGIPVAKTSPSTIRNPPPTPKNPAATPTTSAVPPASQGRLLLSALAPTWIVLSSA